MRILVCGGRGYGQINVNYTVGQIAKYKEQLEEFIQALREFSFGVCYLRDNFFPNDEEVTFVTGMAYGADQLPLYWEYLPNVTVEKYPPKWDEHGKAAGPIRNQQMLDTGVDLVIAFPGGNGTADMVRRAKKAGIEVLQID